MERQLNIVEDFNKLELSTHIVKTEKLSFRFYRYKFNVQMDETFVYNNDVNYLELLTEMYNLSYYSASLRYDYINRILMIEYYTD